MSGDSRLEKDTAADPPAGDRREWLVGPAEEGRRLDQFLAGALGISRANARRTLARGAVTWRGRIAELGSKGSQVEQGDEIRVAEVVDPGTALPEPEPDRPLVILARGPGWLAVDKPAGIPVHPLEPGERGSMSNALVAREPDILGIGEGGLRSGVVHRLDVETSGVLLFATEQERWMNLRDAFRRHRVRKTYWALVSGRLAGEGELALQLAVAQHRPARVRVVSGDDPRHGRGRPTRLAWKSLRATDRASLIEVRPATGFLHQIRVSLAHLGHPLFGDLAYGGPTDEVAPRHLLHARHLRWHDVEAGTEPPADFVEAQRVLLV